MTIDERLEALIARHEALAQSVELLVGLHRDNEQAQREIEKAWKEREQAQKERDEAQNERDVRIDMLHADMMLAIARLANTAEAHNGQLADHDERLDHLENK